MDSVIYRGAPRFDSYSRVDSGRGSGLERHKVASIGHSVAILQIYSAPHTLSPPPHLFPSRDSKLLCWMKASWRWVDVIRSACRAPLLVVLWK